MLKFRQAATAAALLAVGYLWGAGAIEQRAGHAQELAGGLNQDTVNKIRGAYRTLVDSMDALKAQGKYEGITEGVNTFLVLTGGGNARTDLQSGRGVDPETFAALYAGKALPEIQPLLGVDDQGRLTYNNEVIRIYSKTRLQSLQSQKSKLVDVGL